MAGADSQCLRSEPCPHPVRVRRAMSPPGRGTSPSCEELKMRRTPRSLPLRHRGFTLLELLVVMVIIGLLAGFVAPRYFAQVGKSQVKVTRAQLDALDKALDQFRLDVGRYPTSEEGLQVLVTAPSNVAGWAGPYLKKGVPPDPWGHAYQYRSPGSKGEYEIVSFGKDGQPGGSGDNADISSL